MPSLLKIKVERARDLPAMDSASSGDASTDAFVEIRLGDQQTKRTQTYRKSLNPLWGEEFRFEVMDDSTLQDAPVEFRVMDQDLYSSELIGAVYIDLNPLIMRTALHGADRDLIIQGWFPLFDTLKGIRGSLYVTVKLQFIGNENPFRDSSAGVQFFSVSSLSPRAFVIQEILGWVVDLVVEDDPESSWQDYFRKAANKSSNDSRLRVLYNLSAEVRRELGKKVIDMGGNAVLGFQTHFDLEGASGLVVRAYGTACRLLKVSDNVSTHNLVALPPSARIGSLATLATLAAVSADVGDGSGVGDGVGGGSGIGGVGGGASGGGGGGSSSGGGGNSGVAGGPLGIGGASLLAPSLRHLTASSVEALNSLVLLQPSKSHPLLGIAIPLISFGAPAAGRGGVRDLGMVSQRETFRGGSDHHILFGGLGGGGPGGEGWGVSGVLQENSTLEVELLPMKSFPRHVRVRLGGLVMARSVKFLGKLEATLSDQETREGWWDELRHEIKNNARTMFCTHIIAYSETCSIYGDVCVLSAVGTAAVVKGLVCPTAILPLAAAIDDDEGSGLGSYLPGGSPGRS